MQLRYEQLTTHLQKQLAPLYYISGDVPLFMQEACDAIRQAAQQRGYNDRQVFHSEAGFSWNAFLSNADNLSLFSDKQLIELRLNNQALGDAGSKALQAYAARLPADKILLITGPKLESSTQRTNWFQALLNAGIVIQIWPIEKQQLPQWIQARLTQTKLTATSDGVQLLADRAEGNLLACMQEIEKLRLIYGENHHLSLEDIVQAVADSARFDIFQLSDAALAGDNKRVLRVINGLHEEGTEAILILWALTRELRSLSAQASALSQGASLEKIFQEHRVWDKRKPLIRNALQRLKIQTIYTLLQQAAQIDRMIKGLEAGNVWNELTDLALNMVKPKQ